MWRGLLAGVLAALALSSAPTAALECRTLTHAGASYTLCEVDAARDQMRLFLRDKTSTMGSFSRVEQHLANQGLRLGFAMNAGMYHQDRSPVGLYIEAGVQHMRLVANRGPGNFGLLPNGVFCIRANRADVIETLRYRARPPRCHYASQSGPMLVIDGKLHPRFLKNSDSVHIRNGVGTSADGRRVVFAISNDPVRFYDFATLFRDRLKLPQALFFDGKISRAYIAEDAIRGGRHDRGLALGPILGVVLPR